MRGLVGNSAALSLIAFLSAFLWGEDSPTRKLAFWELRAVAGERWGEKPSSNELHWKDRRKKEPQERNQLTFLTPKNGQNDKVRLTYVSDMSASPIQTKQERSWTPAPCSNLSSELEQSCFGSPDRPQASWSSAHPHTVGWAWVEGKAHWTWYLFLYHETEASLPSSLLTSHGPLVSVDSTIGLRPVTVSTIGLRTVATCCIILSIISWFSFPTCCLIIATSWLVILAGATAGRGLAGGATTARLASAAICEDPSAGGCLVPSF